MGNGLARFYGDSLVSMTTGNYVNEYVAQAGRQAGR